MVGARLENRRFGGGRRRFEKASSWLPRRRLVTFNVCNIIISPPTTASPPTVPPKQPSLPLPQPSITPFSSFSNPQKPHLHHPPLFSSFADLFKSNPTSRPTAPHPLPPSQRGILPLPEAGWTTVFYKKRRSSAYHPTRPIPPPPKPKRCFFCGDRSHMARSCSLGDFKCFACNSIGHTSASCTNKKNPPLLSITPPSSNPSPLFIPAIDLPESVIENMEAYSCFGFFSLQVGNPSYEELIANLEFHLKVERWSFDIRPISPSSYFIQFPNKETLNLACSKEFFDMGTFGVLLCHGLKLNAFVNDSTGTITRLNIFVNNSKGIVTQLFNNTLAATTSLGYLAESRRERRERRYISAPHTGPATNKMANVVTRASRRAPSRAIKSMVGWPPTWPFACETKIIRRNGTITARR